MKYRLFCTLFIALSVVSCEKFLSEVPTKATNQPIETLAQLRGLLDDPGLYSLTNHPMLFGTDDLYIIPEHYDANPNMFPMEVLYHYTYKTTEVAALLEDLVWTPAYEKIYVANLIFDYLDKVDGTPAEKALVKADAHFLRAYYYWILADTYALPYCEANLGEPGPARRLTSDMEESVPRMTVGETYELILSDLTEALKIEVVQPANHWRSSKATVNALLSRVYLHMGRYEEAAEAATFAITNAGAKTHLIDYSTIMSLGPGFFDFPETAFQYTEKMVVEWGEFFYAQIGLSRGLMPVSPSLLAMYDTQNDLRYLKFIKDGTMYGLMTAKIYAMFMGGVGIPSGPSLPEIMLNKAEALLRQTSPDIPGALAVVNQLRAKRFVPGYDGVDLPSGTRDEVLRAVLDERRRELPLTHRWSDIRRFAVNETAWDDVAVEREFYKLANGAVDKSGTETYSLPAGSRRYAAPINTIEIEAAKGQIEQNKY